MHKVVADASLREKLNGFTEQVPVYDESGEIVGHFVPREKYRDLLNALAEALFTKADFERKAMPGEGKTLKEIWEQLGQL